jgi:molybdate transport system substrate-binding protein
MLRCTLSITALAAVAVTLTTGCGPAGKTAPNTAASAGGGGASTRPQAISGGVTVFAAASLKEAFTTLAAQFEAAHPGVKVKLSFGASSTLAQQIKQGAPADVFASASPKNMQQVTVAGRASSSIDFAKNVMEIAVPPSNPAQVTGLPDLAKNGIKVALCQAQVPCGATALKVLANAGITVKPVTLEADVKSTLTKVELNEVDAALVYLTDVRAAGSKAKGIEIPDDMNAATAYPIAALTEAPNSTGAHAFLAYVRSADGQAVLTAAGFEKP